MQTFIRRDIRERTADACVSITRRIRCSERSSRDFREDDEQWDAQLGELIVAKRANRPYCTPSERRNGQRALFPVCH